jgi:hypothetical protein
LEKILKVRIYEESNPLNDNIILKVTDEEAEGKVLKVELIYEDAYQTYLRLL